MTRKELKVSNANMASPLKKVALLLFEQNKSNLYAFNRNYQKTTKWHCYKHREFIP